VFFGLLDPDLYIISTDPDLDPVLILVLFKEKGNSMLKIIKQSKHLLRKVIKQYKKYNYSVWGHLKVMVTSYKIKFLF
jgi:alpha-amylase/alpha-mannosidase (GH57 family)